MKDGLKITLIATVKNEEFSIRDFLDALLSQTRLPNEIIVTDGGSVDRTTEIVNEYITNGAPIKLIIAKGNRSVGRNEAIRNASYDIIACTDAGCRADPDWLKNIIEPFENDQSIDVVGGFYQPIANNIFGKCVGVLTICDIKRIDPNTFLPSARSVAFKKEAWRKVGGFPEQFSWNEDTSFMLNLRKVGLKFIFVPRAIVYRRVESNLKEIFWKYHFYAKGDAEACLSKKKYSLFYIRYLMGAILVSIGFIFWPLWCIALLCLIAYLAKYAIKVFVKVRSAKGLVWGPLIKLAIDFAVLSGFGRGLFSSKNEYCKDLGKWKHKGGNNDKKKHKKEL